jgi:hypothetical protein
MRFKRADLLRIFSVLLFAGMLVHCGGEAEEPASPLTDDKPAATAETPDSPSGPTEGADNLVGEVSVTRIPAKDGGQFDTVRRYTQQFYAGEFEKLHDRFSDEMKEVVPLEKLEEIHAFVVDQYGREIEVVGEDTQTNEDYRAFVRWARFSDHDGIIEIQWILHDDDTIAGFFVQPAERPSGS